MISWLAIVVVVELLGRLLGGDPLGRQSVGARLAEMPDGRVALGLVVVVVLYEVVPVAVKGATLGKASLGCRVVRTDTWDRPGALRATLRAAVLYAPLAIPVAGLIVLAVIVAPALLWPTRRGLHDVVAGTAVIGGGRP